MRSYNPWDYVFDFLAVRRPVRTDVLVVEGWLWNSLLRRAAEQFREGGYRLVVVTGIGVSADPSMRVQQTARRLTALGVPESCIETAGGRARRFHKTAAAGRALGKWLDARPSISAVNIVTHAPHARKTFVIYRRLLGRRIKVGIIPVMSEDMATIRRRRGFRFSLGLALYFAKQLFGSIYAALWPFSAA